jgi:hypothetical protein
MACQGTVGVAAPNDAPVDVDTLHANDAPNAVPGDADTLDAFMDTMQDGR